MSAQLNEANPSTAIAEYTATEAALADLRTKYEAVVYDVTDAKTMKLAKEARAEIKGYRVALEKCRVEIKAPALERCRAIDADAKRITAELLALEEPIDAQIKAEETRKERERAEAEERERQRVAAINARFDAIKALPQRAAGLDSAAVAAMIGEAEAIDPTTFPADLQDAAKYEQRLAINALRAEHDKALQREADARELARLRAAAAEVEAERQRLAEIERQRVADEAARAKAAADIERAEQAARDAQEAAARAAEQAERDQAEAVRQAEERATREAEAREQQRREQEQREAEAQRQEDERRAANVKHRAKVNNAARTALMAAGFDEAQATRIVTLIASGKVPAVSIHY